MKKIYILASLALSVGLTSCYDLSTSPMGGVLTEDQREEIFESDPAKLDALANGIYKNYNGFELCYGDNLDFGYPGIMLQLDLRTAVMVGTNPDLYGWFSGPVEYLDNTANSPYGTIRWRFPYNTIYTANQALSIISADTEDDLMKYYRGQAYGNRAFAYWVLAQLFQFNYVGHEEDMCVPIITEENQDQVVQDGAPRATVQAVYDQILSDLEKGIALMEGNSSAVRADKRYMDINVLYGLRARAYLCMQEYDKAAQDAKTVIDSGLFTPLSSNEAIGPGFIDLNSHNWIWGIYYAVEDVMGLYTLPGFLGSYTYGYATAGEYKLINNNTWSRISLNDPRKLWWISPSGDSNAQYYTSADGNAVDYLSNTPPYAVVKFAPYGNVLGQSVNESDIPLMRIEEMYYILAEAQGLGGDLTQGKQTLENFVNSYRWLNRNNPYSCSATTEEAFIDEIFFQRSVEFWGEGLTYFDIMRFGLPVDRTNSNWSDAANAVSSFAYYIEPTNPVLLTQIPQSEIDNNKQISDADQNPTGTASR